MQTTSHESCKGWCCDHYKLVLNVLNTGGVKFVTVKIDTRGLNFDRVKSRGPNFNRVKIGNEWVKFDNVKIDTRGAYFD